MESSRRRSAGSRRLASSRHRHLPPSRRHPRARLAAPRAQASDRSPEPPPVKAFRIVVGIFVSAAFAWATLSRVDLPEVGPALSRAAPFGVALALGCAWLEIPLRSWRWRFLLSPLGKVGYGQAFAYTCVGSFANPFLPMRLGDVARAYLAATALRLPRLATLGSVVTERMTDGLTILVLAAGLGFMVLDRSKVAHVELWVGLAVASGTALIGLGALFAARRRVVETLVPGRVRVFVARL